MDDSYVRWHFKTDEKQPRQGETSTVLILNRDCPDSPIAAVKITANFGQGALGTKYDSSKPYRMEIYFKDAEADEAIKDINQGLRGRKMRVDNKQFSYVTESELDKHPEYQSLMSELKNPQECNYAYKVHMGNIGDSHVDYKTLSSALKVLQGNGLIEENTLKVTGTFSLELEKAGLTGTGATAYGGRGG